MTERDRLIVERNAARELAAKAIRRQRQVAARNARLTDEIQQQSDLIDAAIDQGYLPNELVRQYLGDAAVSDSPDSSIADKLIDTDKDLSVAGRHTIACPQCGVEVAHNCEYDTDARQQGSD